MSAVPELRFPEFAGQWRKSTLSAESVSLDSKRIPLKEGDRDKREGVYPYYGASGIIDHIDDYIFDEKVILLAEDGANILSRSSPIAFLVSGKSWVNNHAHVYRATGSSEFLVACLENIRYEKYNTGTVQPKLNAEICAKIPLRVPTLPEQQKIAAFLGAVDDKIDALRRKHDALKQFKAGLMQKLFSQELRFKRDDGSDYPDWEEKRLGELLQVKYGKDHKALPDGDIPVYGTGGVMRHVDRAIHAGPSILIGRKGTIDRPRFATDPFWTVDTLFYSDISPDFIPFFAFLVVQSVNWLRYNEATGVPSLSATAIHSVKVQVSLNLEEQQRIADAISAVDAKVDAVAGQITHMEAFKAGLLQKMFV